MTSTLNLTLVLALMTSILIIVAAADGKNKSKYSKQANVKATTPMEEIAQNLESKNPFRMNKFNLFWEKVKTASHLSEEERMQLFIDLKKHDEGEIELKHTKAEGGDADGEQEARLRHSFVDIMKRFDLRNHLTPELKSQYAKAEEKNHFDKRIKDLESEEAKKLRSRAANAADGDKVATLIKQAKESQDFDAAEIRDLEEEMRHFSERREEKDLLQRGNDDELWESVEKQAEDKKTAKRKKLKMDSAGGLDDQLIAARTKNGQLDGFHHPRVLKLWDAAQRSSFNNEELGELKEELKHFEVKLMKHETVDEQAAILRSETTGGDPLFHEIEEKREEMSRGIKKMETYLERKIAAPKSEL